VDAATKAGLLGLLDDASDAGWSLAGACRQLELGEVRAHRWRERRDAGELEDAVPGGHPMHGLLDDEVQAIIAMYHDWGEIDRSHRKLAHRGSYTNTVWVAPSSVRRVLAAHGLVLHPPKRPGSSTRKPFPDWVEYRPKQIWVYDTTHFPRCGAAVIIVEDLVSRKWLDHIVSVEETSTQVEIVFTNALAKEGLLDVVERRQDGRVDVATDDPARPILLALSDNGAQMTSGSTREFMALCAIAQHFGRPGTPTDQAWIESFNGHLKAEYPHLEKITDIAVLRRELDVIRPRWNGVRLHAGVGYVTPDDEHEGRGRAIRKAREAGLEAARLRRLAYHRSTRPTTKPETR
jgi:transposase InsO family protein